MAENTVGLFGTWVTLYWVLYAITNIGCAYFVYQDAIKQSLLPLNVGPFWWGLFSLIGGVLPLAAYWLMQHSSLAKRGE